MHIFFFSFFFKAGRDLLAITSLHLFPYTDLANDRESGGGGGGEGRRTGGSGGG